MTGTVEPPDWTHWERVFGLQLSPREKQLTVAYLRLLFKWRKSINLTGRGTVADFLQFDFFESFWLADHFTATAGRLVDIGSGAGFPGLAVKIRRPELPVILIEPNQKKVVFLGHAARKLGLEVECFHGKAEQFTGWRPGDLATIRALRPSRVLLATLRRCAVGLLCLHGHRLPRELESAEVHLSKTVPGSRGRFASHF